MAKQKTGLTIERHREIAGELQRIEKLLWQITDDVTAGYSKARSRPVRNTIQKITGLRGQMDDLLHHDNPGKSIDVYYRAPAGHSSESTTGQARNQD
ncbi:hypothetical protein NHH03_16830 [Stieleria sp. TO1_6]|uniref:hypothetical protein n=1 Tax=Stieleria tagensis TaxID=2956795 RepID=UPI00209A68D4|nr:hypothetical protein [Stieleria tagensis]MCO8123417.1 hypothetical protein [Stieleria tagensis]